MAQPKTKNELRCFCSRKPLLAMYGIDERGQTYVHCRVYKQQKVYGDWLCYGGIVVIMCRECLRWHRITFVNSPKVTAELTETPVPTEIAHSGNMAGVTASGSQAESVVEKLNRSDA